MLVGRTASGPSAPTVPAGELPRSRRRSALIPDVALTTHEGREVRFRRDLVEDRIVLISFLYARCEGSCPTTTWSLRRLRERLTATLGPRAVMVSVTLDPEHDRPSVLATYARRHGADASRPGLLPWEFLTGRPADIEELRVALGYRDLDPVVDADRSNHAAMVTFGNDRTDRWSALPAALHHDRLFAGIVRTVLPSSARPA